MPLIYITGIETAGKSTACNELKKLGYEAYDIDDGIAHYYNKVTGKRSEWISSAAARSEDWHIHNDYKMDREQVERFAEQAKDKIIFLCGTTQNDDVVIDLFDTIVYLYLDETTLRQRMQGRHAGEFAFADHEKQAILGWHTSSEEAYRKRGAIMIDATQPIKQISDEILEGVQK